MKNKKLILKIENHPVLVGRKAQLDPYQPGLLRKSKNDILEKIGAEYEKEIVEKLRNYFEKRDEKFLIFENIYFETGEYSEKLKVYRTIQIDILVITQYVIIPVEVKYISDAYCKRIAGGADSRSWNLIKYLSRSRMTNGVRQNRMHTQFTGELVDFLGINIPICGMTVIGYLDKNKIEVQQMLDDNLVVEEDMLDMVDYIIKTHSTTEHYDVDEIGAKLEKWICRTEGRDVLHKFFLRNVKKNKVPERCKGILKHNDICVDD